jgi:uncharacterized Zn-binding protein involved in type VI secretion
MPAVVRLADLCSGHHCYPPRPNVAASTDVFVNRLGAHRQTDAWARHCCGVACHASVTAGGSGSVFVNGLPLARIGDPVACGSICAQGSHNVYAGG